MIFYQRGGVRSEITFCFEKVSLICYVTYISRKICNLTVLKDHQNMTYVTSWIFTAALAADLLEYLENSFLVGKSKIIGILVTFLMLAGSGFLIYVGHLGAELVYQQGAGVYVSAKDCLEFNY